LKKFGSGQDHNICLIFSNEISLTMIQHVTNDGGSVFFAIYIHTKRSKNDFVSMCCTHNQW